MVGIGRLVVILKMASDAVRRRCGKNKIRMAILALQQGMGSAKGKSGCAPVIESCQPAVHAVTRFTGEGKSGRLVIHHFRLDVILVMTGIAVGAESTELTDRPAGMAILALECGVRPKKREPVQVPVRMPTDIVPTANAVAFLAVRTQLAAVYICVAVHTLGFDIRKNQVLVAVPAIDAGMHSFQRETGGAMIEIGRGADGNKASRFMAFTAGNLDTFPVRIAVSSPLLKRRHKSAGAEQQDEQKQYYAQGDRSGFASAGPRIPRARYLSGIPR